MKELKWWEHITRSIQNGQWNAGFATRKSWPGKPQFELFTTYYDGWHWVVHIGPFYIGASYYL